MKTLLSVILVLMTSCASYSSYLDEPIVAHSGVSPEIQECIEILGSSTMTMPHYSVTVQVNDIDNLGVTYWDENDYHFVIVLDEGLSADALVHVIAHEWAHVLTWDVPNARNHGPMFGVAMSRCLEALYGEGPYYDG